MPEIRHQCLTQEQTLEELCRDVDTVVLPRLALLERNIEQLQKATYRLAVASMATALAGIVIAVMNHF